MQTEKNRDEISKGYNITFSWDISIFKCRSLDQNLKAEHNESALK